MRHSAVLLGEPRYWLLLLSPLPWLAAQAVLLIAAIVAACHDRIGRGWTSIPPRTHKL